jgi:hypothetical protein
LTQEVRAGRIRLLLRRNPREKAFSGAFLLVLIVTTMPVAGLSIRMQELIEGASVVLVLALSGGGCFGRALTDQCSLIVRLPFLLWR